MRRYGLHVGTIAIAAPAFALLGVPLLAGVLAGAGAVFIGVASKRNGVPPRARTLPRRWSMTPPPRHSTRVIAMGPAVSEERLLAPFSGRECIAYEISVKDGRNASAGSGSCLLLEQNHVALTVDATHVGIASAHLQLDAAIQPIVDDAVARVLRARGVDPCHPDLLLSETIVEPRADVELRTDGDTLVITRARSTAPPSRRRP